MLGPRGARPRLRMPRQPSPPQPPGGVAQDGPQRWGVPLPTGTPPPNGTEHPAVRRHAAAPHEMVAQDRSSPSWQSDSASPSPQPGPGHSSPALSAPHPAGVQPTLPQANANPPTPPNHQSDFNQNSNQHNNPSISRFQQHAQQSSIQAKPYPNASELAGVMSNGQAPSSHGRQPLNSHPAAPAVSSQQPRVTPGEHGAPAAAVQQTKAHPAARDMGAGKTGGTGSTAPSSPHSLAADRKPQISKVERTLDNFFGKTDKLLAKFDKTLTEKLLDPSHTSPTPPMTSSAAAPAPAPAAVAQQQQQQQSERGLLTSLQSSLKGKVSEGLGSLMAPPQPPATLRSLHTDVSQSINLSAQALRAAEARADASSGHQQVQISGLTAVPVTVASGTSSLSGQLGSQQQEQLLHQQLLLQQQQQEIARLQELQKERERELELKAEQQKQEYQRQLRLSREHERAALAQATVQKPQAAPISAPSGTLGTKIYVPTPLVVAAAGKAQNTAADLLSLLKPPSASSTGPAVTGTASTVPASSLVTAGGEVTSVTSAGISTTGTGGPVSQGAFPTFEAASSDLDFEHRMSRRKRFLQQLASLGAEADSPPSPGESPLLALESCSDRLATPSPMSSVGRIDDEALCSERERPSSAPEIKARSQFSSRFGVHIPAGFLDMPDDDLELRPSAPSPVVRLGDTPPARARDLIQRLPRDMSPYGARDLTQRVSRDMSPLRTRGLLQDEPRDTLRDLQRDVLRAGPRDGPRESSARDGLPVLPSSFKSPRERTTLQASLIRHPPATVAAPPDSPSPPERDPSHVIRYCDIQSDEEEEEEEEESDAESSGPCSVALEPSPGAVYTIEEADEEAGTPTAPDGVSRRRRSSGKSAGGDRRPRNSRWFRGR